MTIVFKISDNIKPKMIKYYEDLKRDKTPPYAIFQAEEGGTIITLYESGKVMFQGISADIDANIWIDMEKQVVYVSNNDTGSKKQNKKKDTLESIIEKVNERFDGDFTESDRVIIEGIYRMFMDDKDVKKFKKYASDNSTEMFVQSLFPDKFKEIVTQCFLENNESFQKLFNDPDFYQMVQDVMAN